MAGLDLAATIFNKLDLLKQEVNKQLMVRPVARGTVAQQACWVRTNFAGGETIFPVGFWSQTAKKRSPYEEVEHVPPELVNFSCPVWEWAPDGEVIPRGTQVADLYGLFEDRLPQIVVQAQNEYEWHLAELLGFGHLSTLGPLGIGGGNTAYDGTPHFGVNKPANPNRPLIGNFTNFNNALRLERQGLIKAFQMLEGVPGPDGRPLRMPGELLVIVSNEDQYDRAAAELFTKIRAVPIGAAAGAGVDNTPNVQGRAGLVKLPDLNSFDNGKGWYVIKLVSAEHRPFVINLKEAPSTYIEGLSPNEHSRVTRNLIRYGWRGFWGMGYLWPQLSFKALEP